MGNEVAVDVGFIKFSGKGVEVKPQFKVGYQDENVHLGGGADFSKGVAFDANCKADIDGQQWGGGGGYGIDVTDGVKASANYDMQVHGNKLASGKGSAGVKVTDGNFITKADADGNYMGYDVSGGVDIHGGKNGWGTSASAGVGYKFGPFDANNLKDFAKQILKQLKEKNKFSFSPAALLLKMGVWDEIVMSICDAVNLGQFTWCDMEYSFSVMTGVGFSLDVKEGLKDDDGFYMYGASFSIQAVSDWSGSLYVGYHQYDNKVKIKGSALNLAFQIIIKNVGNTKEYIKKYY